MQTWRRIAVGSAVALVAAGAAFAVAVHVLVDPERVKALAREKARAAWGRELTIGEVSVSLLPAPAISARDVMLSAQGTGTPFLQAKRIDARLELLPLLTGHARLKSLELDGATVNVPDKGTHEVPDVSPEATRRASASPQLLDLTDLRLANVDVVTGPTGERVTWHVRDGTFAADPGWRDAEVDATLERNGEPVHVEAKIADLSRVGAAGASSDGEVQLAWKHTRVKLAGRLPLARGAVPSRLHVDLQSPSLGDVFAFYALERHQSAPVEAHFDVATRERTIEVTNLDLTLGKAHGRGAFSLRPFETPGAFDGRIAIDSLDWAQAMLDVGTPAPPKRNTGLAFNPDKLAWPLLEKLEGWKGTLDADVAALKLRNGVQLGKAKFRFAFDGARLDVDPLQAELLGGKGTAQLHFDAAKKSVKVAFDGTSLLLERWFHERGRPVPFTGGPMTVHADLSSSGATMRDLAASATGPFTVRMGPGAWNSKHAGDKEALMTNAFASEGAEKVQFECVTANLPFKKGVARGRSMVGFTTEASELITSGIVNLRDESVDLHGRVRAHKGVTLGLADIAGDVKIGGHLTKLSMSLDPEATPGVIARAGAAIATLGLSVMGTALIDKMDSEREDPCEKPVRKAGGEAAGR